MASLVQKLGEAVLTWPGVVKSPHQFGASEFRLGKAEIGHVHFWGDVDIPFTREIRDELIASGLAARHRWLPDSGWITFHLGSERDLSHALWLMQLSHLRYLLKRSGDPQSVLEQETARMRLNPKLIALLTRFLPSDKPAAPTTATIAAQVN